MANRPRAVVCHICGRQYGTTSIDIHLKTCVKMWESQEAQKPKHLRRPVPQAPEIPTAIASGGKTMTAAEMLDARNAAAFDQFNTTSLSRCENCGRTFLPDRLVIHQRSCRPGNTAKPVGAPTLGGAGAPNHPIRAHAVAASPDTATMAETWTPNAIKLATTSSPLPPRPRTSGGVSGRYDPVLGGAGSEVPSPIDLSATSSVSEGPPRKKTPLKGRRSRPNLAQTDASFPSDDEISAALASTSFVSDGPVDVSGIESKLAGMEKLAELLLKEIAATRVMVSALKASTVEPTPTHAGMTASVRFTEPPVSARSRSSYQG